LDDSGVFNIFESKVLENLFDIESLNFECTIDESLILVELPSRLYRRVSGGWEDVYEKTLNDLFANVGANSCVLLTQSRYQMNQYGPGSTRDIIQRNGLYQKFSLFIEADRYKSLFVESVDSLSDKPNLYYGFYILFLAHEKTDETFVARSIGADQLSSVVDNVLKSKNLTKPNDSSSDEGFFVQTNKFLSWDKWDQYIRYKNTLEKNSLYKNVLLEELYLAPPRLIDENYAFDVKEENSLEVRNIKFQLDPNLINIKYIEWFLKTELGQSCYDFSLPFSGEFNFLDRFSKTLIPLPSIQMQLTIISEVEKIQLIKEKLNSFQGMKFESVLYADYFSDTAKKINQILDVFESLSDSEKLIQLILSGESKTLEFKQTLSLDIKTGVKAKYIEDSVIKTIAAFLNSDGGTLLIGVEDEGNIIGVNREIDFLFKSKDKYLLHLKNIIMSRLGADLYPLIDQRAIFLNSKDIVVIKCSPSNSEVYVDGKDFYVRTNPSTDKLEGPKLVGYIKNRFR
jgi:hypothetical protein